jgi:hypothetical protein
LQWFDDSKGKENGKRIDQILQLNTPDNKPIRYLFFELNEELYQYDVQEKCLLKPIHTNYINLSCHPIEVASKESATIFKRLVLQVRPLSDFVKNLFEKGKAQQIKFVENGAVLAESLYHTSRIKKSRKTLPILVHNSSGLLRNQLVPSLNTLLVEHWNVMNE